MNNTAQENPKKSHAIRNTILALIAIIIFVIIGFFIGSKFNLSLDNILSNAVKEGINSVNEKMIEAPESAKKFLENINPQQDIIPSNLPTAIPNKIPSSMPTLPINSFF